jgi:hypothetical protein
MGGFVLAVSAREDDVLSQKRNLLPAVRGLEGVYFSRQIGKLLVAGDFL